MSKIPPRSPGGIMINSLYKSKLIVNKPLPNPEETECLYVILVCVFLVHIQLSAAKLGL